MDEIAQIKDRLDILEIISSYLTVKKAGVNYKAPCPFHTEKTPSFMISPERQTYKCFGCFPAGQYVQTENGLEEIQKIKKGDLVFTDKGRLKKVDITFKRKYIGDLIEVVPRMVSTPVKMTGDHKVYAIKTKNCKQKSRLSRICQSNCKQNCPTKYFREYKVEKIKAREITKNDYLLYPIKQSDENNLKIKLSDYFELKRGKKPRELPEMVDVDSNMARLAGLYIAEGSSHRAYIRFSLGNHEKELAEEIIRLLKKIFNLNSSIYFCKLPKTGIEITCCNSALSQIFKNMFGKGANKKRVPFFLQLNSNVAIRKALLKGIFDGDGTRIKESASEKMGRYSITTVSEELFHQLKDLLLSLEQRPSCYFRKAYKSKGNISHQTSYHLNWREDDKSHYSDFLILDGVKNWILPVNKITKSTFTGYVYNLNVEKDHSYLTSSFAVANCGEGGDIFTFIEKMEGVDFYNALKILADRAGVKLSPKRIRHNDKDYEPDQTTKMFEINDWAAKVYHKVLTDHPKAVKARAYLEKRGLTDETIKEFQIGYAPNSWDFLIKFLSMKKYDESEVFKAGLLVQRQGGGFYDRFRGRITFPINNIMGACVGFTTRLLDDNPKEAKYINSAESPIYKKSKIIYGLDKAKMAIKDSNLAIVVEGNMDVIACHQAGFKNVVASSGTALTLDQLTILTRYSPDIAFSFDSDNAGQAAMKKAVALALQNDISTKIISLPLNYKDPDEAIKANPKHWSEAVEKTKPSLEHWIDLLIKNAKTLDVSTKKNIAREILPIIKIIYSEIEKEHYIKYLSMRLGISEKSLNQALDKSKSLVLEKRYGEKEGKDSNADKKSLNIFERLAGVIWGDLKIKDKILASPSGGENTKNIKYLGEDKTLHKFYDNLLKDQLLESQFSDEEKNQLNQISLTVLADFDDKSEVNLLAEAEYLIKSIERESREQIKQEFVVKIKQAEAAGDRAKIKELMEELSGLIK